MSAREQRRDDLFDALVAEPDGLTVQDMMDDNGWSHHQCNEAIRDLRRFLGDSGDSINLVCDPQGWNQRWLYRLVGSLADVRDWSRNRIRDGESRVRTMQAVMTSIVAATDGRSAEGRKARVMERGLRRLVEDLDELAGRVS